MVAEKLSKPASKLPALIGLAIIVALGAGLRFYRLGATGVGNEYYAATVKSMLQSWHNFFFVAFEPGGSISVDKPPLGFWLETASAWCFGLNGFALAFPNALAGVLCLPLLYALVARQFGRLAGLTAALVLAVTPITIATERNNTVDGMLVFFLLLAAAAVWKSVESGRFRFMLLGMLLVGLGFNIKMLQAYMILPALGGLYFFGAKQGWGKRIVHLAAAGLLLLVVSLSWALIVDAVPASARPFIGSSTDNTVTELILGHNGAARLVGGAAPNGSGSQSDPSQEVGAAGIFRLFTEPLAPQASWLLPLALLGGLLTLGRLGKPWPLTDRHLALLLWAGWLLPCLLYFTFTGGAWHTYYLIMIGPSLAALLGGAVWSFAKRPNGGWLALVSGITLAFEGFVLSAYPAYFTLTFALMACLWLTGLALLKLRPRTWAPGLIFCSLLLGPLLWSGLTSLNPQPEVDLPRAGPALGPGTQDSVLSDNQEKILAYLLSHTAPNSYLFATLDSHGASAFILATGRPVLTFGGYVGTDNVIDAAGLQELVASGRLRFVLDNNNLSGKPQIAAWVEANCRVVKVPGAVASTRQASGGPRNQQFKALYDCGS